MSMRPTSGVRYDMPVSFGPSVAPAVTRGVEVHSASVSFRTEAAAVEALLPRWFVPSEPPTITVTWQRLVGLDWMGGRSYNLVAIYAAAVYPPEKLSGAFGLAVWESDCAPVISGREYMGTPKLFGRVSDADIDAKNFGFTCHEYEGLLLAAELSSMAPLEGAELETVREAGRNRTSFNWKYIPSCSGPPDADYPVANFVSYPWDRAWRGTGGVTFHRPDDRTAPYSGKIARTLADLPVLEQLPSFAGYCSGASIHRDRSRRLTS